MKSLLGRMAGPLGRYGRLVWLAVATSLLPACAPQEPLSIGVIAGLSGPVADLGESSRDGVLLAVEEANATGGIKGRRIVLRVYDDGQNVERAVGAVEALAKDKVEAVIGPVTSGMGMAALPEATKRGLLLISPTITATSLRGHDDALFTISPSLAEMTRKSAEALYARGLRRVAVAHDLRNKAYTSDWLAHFRQDFEALGGQVVVDVPFSSDDLVSVEVVARRLIDPKPDALHFVCGAVDAVRLVQAIRHLGSQAAISSATWAATEHLIQLGGRSVEGMLTSQLFNRDDEAPSYLAFRKRFVARFNQEPGFPAVAAYDATRALLAAYALRSAGQSLKAALLAAGPFEGVQERWSFDGSGDARRNTVVAVVREGRFVTVLATEGK